MTSRWLLALLTLASIATIAAGQTTTVSTHVDVKVTHDNNNVDGGTPRPDFDSRNLPQSETTVAISPLDSNLVAIACNDFRFAELVPCGQTVWFGLNVSTDAGATWHNTVIPGFMNDESPEGSASPVRSIGAASDPVVRFDDQGNLYVLGISKLCTPEGEHATPGSLSQGALVFLARYAYTPGSPGESSTPTSAGNPPGFTYMSTAVVDFAPVGDGVDARGVPFSGGGAVILLDKPWMGIDRNPSSPFYGRIYVGWVPLRGDGYTQVRFASSDDGGLTFSQTEQISQGGGNSVGSMGGPSLSVARDGSIYAAWINTPATPTDGGLAELQIARSVDGGGKFDHPVSAGFFDLMPRFVEGLEFRTIGFFLDIAVDDTDSNKVYITYTALTGSPRHADIFVVRSTDAAQTWSAPARVNDDTTRKHQFFPTIDVVHGVLHVAWCDLRESANPDDPAATNDALNVYYAYSNLGSVAFPAFSANVRVTDSGFEPNCIIGSTHNLGDYIEIAARYDVATGQHIAHVAWCDARDIPPSLCFNSDPIDMTNLADGRVNLNIYADVITVTTTP